MADIPINPVTRRVEFTGNTGTGPFAFTFNVLAQADVAVYKNNTLLALTSDYTVSLNSNGTGSITLVSALIATDDLVIIGDLPLSRTTDFVTAGDLLASSLNEQFDSNVVMSQQLDERFDRTIRSQPGDINKNLYLPLVDDRVSQLLSFDSSGNITTTNLSNVPDIGTVNLTVSGLASFADGSLGAPSITNIGDTNTGIYFPAADQLAFTAGGNNIFSITSTYGLMSKPLYFSDGILLTDNSATALTIKEGSNNYLTFITTNGSEKLSFGKPIDVTGAITTNTSLNIASSTTVDGILDEDDMSSNSATKLATQQSIKAYVDAQVGTVDTLAEVLGNGNTTGGTDIAVSSGDDITFADNSKAIFGAGSDLQIYHDSADNSSRLIESGTGNFFIGGDNIYLTNSGISEFYLRAVENAGVTLYYDNLQKLNTSSTGVDITGTLTSDGLTVDGAVDFSTGTGSNVVLGNTGSFTGSETAQLVFEEGSTELAQVQWNPSGNTFVLENKIYNAPISFRTFGATERLKIDGATGDISFYEDTGSTAKFFWDASKESVGIGTTSLTPTDGANIELSSATSSRIILDSTGTGGRKYTMASGTNGSLDFYDYDAAAYRMRIDSSGRVGIGTSSPSGSLSAGGLHVTDRIAVGSGSTGTPALHYDADTDTGIFFGTGVVGVSTGGSERMRIDSSGNLLVGKTSAAYNTDGFETHPNGETYVSRSGTPMAINRNSSYGTLLNFYKDGGGVGSIGTDSNGDFVIDGSANHSGLRFKDNTVVPKQNGSDADNAIDLGKSDKRWKDLYLSGGVYLGGVTSSNLLNDYEEGIFTPQIADAISGGNSTTTGNTIAGHYVKVGYIVHVSIRIIFPNTSGLTSGNVLYIRNLPFTCYNASGGFPLAVGTARNINYSHDMITAQVSPNSTYLNLESCRAASLSSPLAEEELTCGQFSGDGTSGSPVLYLGGTYRTT